MERRKQRPPILVRAEKCVGCLTCMLRCSFRKVKAFCPAAADIAVRRTAGGEKEFSVSITEGCDRCGVCARYCLYGALAVGGD